MSPNTDTRPSEYKPLLFTTTVRNPKRMKGLLNVLSKFNNKILNDSIAEIVMGELIRFGLYRPMIQSLDIKAKWKDSKRGEFSNILLTDEEVKWVLINNPQDHKEAGFKRGWPTRFATEYDFAKELGFVYFWPEKEIKFSDMGLKLANSIKITVQENYILVEDFDPEFEQQAFLNAFVKYQNNNPFKRVLNENVPLILLLDVITKLNNDTDFNDSGISKLELPLVIFWKDNDSKALYKLIKKLRTQYKYSPSWEVIIDICVNEIMGGTFKKFKPKSIMVDYPDEFIRKMRLTGLISLRGGGRFIDINKNEQQKVNYALDHYSKYKKYNTEKEYFDYMAKMDESLILSKSKEINADERDRLLNKWVAFYSWSKIKDEMIILAQKNLSKDDILKYLTNPTRLEFLVALAIKSKFPNIKVVPNYPYDDEGLPTSTAGGIGDKGDIECFESINGVLIEVTMSEGRTQTMMEVWPITRHFEKFRKKSKNSMCYFIAPSIFVDSQRQIKYVKKEENIYILSKTIEEFLLMLEKNEQKLYSQA